MGFKSINPTNGECLKEYTTHSEEEVHHILEKAEISFLNWKISPLSFRENLLKKVADLLEEKIDDLSKLITLEMGKPIVQSIAEIRKCALVCRFYAQEASTFLADHTIQTEASSSKVRYLPLGTILGIMPWNFPFWQVFRFTAPALMAGNNVIIKHAPNVPQCSLAIVDIFEEAGAPIGLVQNVFAEIEQIPSIVIHDTIQGISLTGSDRAGSAVASLAGKHIKKCVLELGGSDPFIVLKDADIKQAAYFAARSRMNNSGQTCIAAKRIIVEAEVVDQFTAIFLEEISQMKVGDPLEESTNISCMARPDLVENLERQIKESIEMGAQFILEGGRKEPNSNWVLPSIMHHVHIDMPIMKEEVFGPLAVIVTAKNAKQALRLANENIYGLGASVWTTNEKLALEMADQINAGFVAVNSMVRSDPRLPFGGIKRSGFGRELSKNGILEFVNEKTIVVS